MRRIQTFRSAVTSSGFRMCPPIRQLGTNDVARPTTFRCRGLTSRLAGAGISRAVIGGSGGLDSALIVTVRAMDRLGLPRSHVFGYSMPGFATSERTRKNALALMDSLGITTGEIDIRPSCLQMLKDLRHPYAEGRPVYDVTFENVQAGERTSHLFRLANQHQALVIGTSDLSELALG
jgi:NAD+ synthase (glutamine-hydrolysing)